jgi:hypothetical protein
MLATQILTLSLYLPALTFPVSTTGSSPSQWANYWAQCHLDTLLPELPAHVPASLIGKSLVPAI